jgi:peptide/nickel transport system substrate-binding protein
MRAAALLAAAAAAGLWLACAGEPQAPDRPLRIALHGAPTSWDPHLQSEALAQIVLGHLYESLVTFDTRMRPVPQLAERWENPDDLVWRFTLRPDATFHDGRPVKVEDVLASLARARRHARSRQAGALVAVESWQQIDERTFELRTKTPYPILLNKLAPLSIVPADAPEEIVSPIGTGPYRLVMHDEGQAVLEAMPDYWQRQAGARYPTRVTLFFRGDNEERLRGLIDGRWDLIDELPLSGLREIEGKTNLRVESMSSLAVTYLQFHAVLPPFDDRRVRRAVDLLIDRQTLVAEELLGFGQSVGQMVSSNVFGYNPELLPTTPDPAAARALLAEAGLAQGFDLEIEHREGRDVTLLARQLAAGGIRVRGRSRPWVEMYPRLQSGEVPVYLGTWVCTSGDASDLLDRKLHTPDVEHGWGDANWNGYANERLDRLIEQSQLLLNPLERGSLLKRAMAEAAQDLVYLPLYSDAAVYALRSDLQWSPRRDGRVYAHETTWR